MKDLRQLCTHQKGLSSPSETSNPAEVTKDCCARDEAASTNLRGSAPKETMHPACAAQAEVRALLEVPLTSESGAPDASVLQAFGRAQDVAWEAFADSMLTYNHPCGEKLDLLEIYAYPDGR